MIEQINKGDKLLCQETFTRGDQELYKQGEVYTSQEDHFLTDENGNEQGGWNNEILNQHFKKTQLVTR